MDEPEPAHRHRRPGSAVARVVLNDLVRGNPLLTAGSVLAGGAAVTAQLALPNALAGALTLLTARGRAAPALILCCALLLLNLTASAVGGQLGGRREAATARRHRTELVRHVLRLSPSDTRLSSGELLTRLTMDAETPGRIASICLSAGLTLVIGGGALVLLWRIGWWLAALAAAEVVVSLLVARLFIRDAGQANRAYRAAMGDIAARLHDAYQGIKTIRASGTADRECRRILAPLADLRSAGLARWAAQRDVSWRLELLGPCLQIAILAAAGMGVVRGRLHVGDVIAALAYSRMLLGVLDQVDALAAVSSYAAGARRLIETLAAPVPAPAVSPPSPLPDGPGEIRFEDITLRRDGTAAMADVTFTVPAGTHVAVVGKSGTGKSVLVGLVGRLADPASGRVLLDGTDVRRVDLAVLRRAVAYAFEEPVLFGPSIRAAITAGSPPASGTAEQAARLARADGFIRRLPEGYATPPAGAPLSGGELQRVGLARAFARPARVLVLDDATSSLDTATEAEIGQAIRTSWGGRTALVVAHRASTAAAVDLVAWLDGGTLRALRPHRELWEDPVYRAVFQADQRAASAMALGGT